MKKSCWLIALLVLSLGQAGGTARAQLPNGALRLTIDADTLSVGWTKLAPETGASHRQTTVGIGPNQFGASEVGLPSAPLGFGAGYVLLPKLLLGARIGLGYDRTSSSRDVPSASYLTWTFMPGITYVPRGEQAMLFFNFSPLLEFTRRRQGDTEQVRFGGCFSLGGGTMLFISPTSSIDLGIYFEGRFPDIDQKPQAKTEISDLRWLLRVGLSLWR